MNKIFNIPKYNPFYEYAKEEYNLKPTRDKKFLKCLEAAVKRFQKNFKIFEDIKILFIESKERYLGHYLTGSASSTPIILLSKKAILSCAKELDMDMAIEYVVHTTVFHELAHAMCDLDRDCDGILEYEDEEYEAETFGIDFYEIGYKGIFENFKV